MKRVFTHPSKDKIWGIAEAVCSAIWSSRIAPLGVFTLLLLMGTSQIGFAQTTDTDGDGIDDATEIANDSDPNNPCDPNESAGTCCVYQGTTIDFGTSAGNTDDDHTHIFLLTTTAGVIVDISDESVFAAVNPDLYYIYAINYRTQDGITGLSINRNIDEISSECIDISEPLIVHNCSDVVQVAARVYLQGVYEAVSELMRDDLRVAGHIPNQEPYSNQSGFEHVNNPRNESISNMAFTVTGDDAIVDWVFLELRDANDPALVLATRSALLQRDGDIVDLDGISAVAFDQALGDYYIAVRHRNHLGTMTATPRTATKDPVVIDFTDVDLAVWGEHARKLEDGVAKLWGGNTTIDEFLIFQGASNDVDPVFFNVILSEDNGESITNYIVEGYLNTDTDMNGKTIYQGVNNDLDQLIFFNILAHPSNENTIVNYIVVEQLAK